MNDGQNKKKKFRWKWPVRVGALILAVALLVEIVVPQLTNVTYSQEQYEGTAEEYAAQIIAQNTDYLNGNNIVQGTTLLRSLARDYAGCIAAASVAIGRERYRDAADYLNMAIEAYTGSSSEQLAELYLRKGSLEILCADYPAALQSLTKCLQTCPEEANAYYLRAQINMVSGNIEDAVEDVRNYEEYSGGNTAAEAAFGELYEAAEYYEKAEECYTISLESEELYDIEILIKRARCRIRMGDTAGAQKDLERYFAEGGTDPDLSAATMLCAVNLEKQEFAKAIEIYEKAESEGLQPAIDLKNWMGMAYMGTDDYETALNLFNEVLEEDPDYDKTSYYQALCAYTLEEFELAIDGFTSAISQGTQLQFCYYYRAVSYIHLEQLENAEADLQAVVATQGDETLTESAQDMLDILYAAE